MFVPVFFVYGLMNDVRPNQWILAT